MFTHRFIPKLTLHLILLCVAAIQFTVTPQAHANNEIRMPLSKGIPTSTGARITPNAAPGSVFEPLNPQLPNAPEFHAGQGVTTTIGLDGRTMLVLTSGYNWRADKSGNTLTFDEFIFVYDIA